MSTIASVIIPAYNEERAIRRCLETLLRGSKENELQVIVVCNGCVDGTAAAARSIESTSVSVFESNVASKCNALNIGDQASHFFPRIYLDADIQMTIETVRALVSFLNETPGVLLSAPRAIVDDSASDLWVRAYYRVWTRLPYFNEAMVGSGVYAFSKEGRQRFEKFPEIIGDDEFARRAVRPDERGTPPSGTFTISAPRNLASLLAVNTRVRAGMYQLEQRFPDSKENRGTSPTRTLTEIAKKPSLWKDAPVYLGIMFMAKVRAHRKLAGNSAMFWNRDESARS